MTLKAIVRWVLIALYGNDYVRWPGEGLFWPEPRRVLYPYYTVPAEVRAKRVRVRAHEREVMDFDLYLSADNVWSAEYSKGASE